MKNSVSQQGFSLVELMISTLLGFILSYAVLEIYLAQSQIYKTSNSQSLILSTENALVNLLTPTIRAAGFLGCGTTSTAVSNLNTGSPDPLGSINTQPSMLRGYNGSGASFTIAQTDPPNSSNAALWSPALPSSLVGQTTQGSDILIVLGAVPSTYPLGVTYIDTGSNTLNLLSTTNNSLTTGQLASVSDCVKSVIFQITSVGDSSINHDAGVDSMQNVSSTFPVNFAVGAQLIPIQQAVFFIGQTQGGQSALIKGVLSGSTWTLQPLIPGIEFMKIQYGIGENNLITQYVSANTVTDWAKVYAVRIGFLITGKVGSASTLRRYTVLDTAVTVPADTVLRHTFEMTIQLRNSM